MNEEKDTEEGGSDNSAGERRRVIVKIRSGLRHGEVWSAERFTQNGK